MEYYSLNQYLKNTFGCKVYKIAIDGGFTCPNRDGTCGRDGCIFCSGAGSGDFTPGRNLSITEQINLGKEKLAGKIRDGKYIAYFQAFTNTYAPVSYLEKVYMEAIEAPDIVGISIATRPDCLPEEVIELIGKINSIKPVWVELGLQTIHDKTADYIRRGYGLKVYDEAVKKLLALGIPQIITHVIIGLPGESREDMLETVRYVVASGANGIKLQLLHVLEGTDLAKDYQAGGFETLDMEEYGSIIKDAIDIIPNTMVVHRLTGDGAKKDLIAPMWSANKKSVINYIRKKLEGENV